MCLNAICILNEDRVLAKCKYRVTEQSTLTIRYVISYLHRVVFFFLDGWSTVNREFEDMPTTKTQILSLMKSIRTVVKCKLLVASLEPKV